MARNSGITTWYSLPSSNAWVLVASEVMRWLRGALGSYLTFSPETCRKALLGRGRRLRLRSKASRICAPVSLETAQVSSGVCSKLVICCSVGLLAGIVPDLKETAATSAMVVFDAVHSASAVKSPKLVSRLSALTVDNSSAAPAVTYCSTTAPPANRTTAAIIPILLMPAHHLARPRSGDTHG